MYIALVKVFNTYIRRYILKFCIVGWGKGPTLLANGRGVKGQVQEVASPTTSWAYLCTKPANSNNCSAN